MDDNSAADALLTPKQDGKSRSEEEDEEHDTKGQVPPTTKKPTDRGRGSKRPPTHESDPTVSPTTGRGRKRQTLSSDAVPETEEAKDREIRRLQQELADQKSQMQNLHVLANKGRTLLAQSLVDIAKIEREKERTRLFHEGVRVGKYKPSLAFGQADGWEGGTEKEAIEQLKAKLNQEKVSVEFERRSLQRQIKKAIEPDDGEKDAQSNPTEDPDDPTELREVCNHRAEYIRREEAALKERENRLMADRTLYQKQVLLASTEDRSRFRFYPRLKDRFQLLNAIGKGGFSEIYKAFDLEQMCMCAIKIQEIEAKMSDAQRQDLVRWALRECEIQKSLRHPRIVQLRECFALDINAFVIVLELCQGETLDMRLKMHGPMPEKEAKAITVQILSGLRHLNVSGRKIIHYDIKPSNVFYDAGQVKIGDFGLSKMADSPEGMIDLSTRGAGTSWYLPPECHESASPTINSSLAVWSTGVVFFEMLYNRRPFGEGQTQDAFRRQTAVEGTFDLVFPTSPKVSSEAIKFLRKLLTRDREQRPDVLEALRDPYIRKSWNDQSARSRKSDLTSPKVSAT
ncbi:Serine/threonine-protein kinase TOUSLED [Durusdinium trenchii]|uniref:Serine/threonine-protein kinase TOUSLED n=1 Tax=Durusdinium trenchii TaxID=1381693 RepID=A0ABP0PTW2_9DINO